VPGGARFRLPVAALIAAVTLAVTPGLSLPTHGATITWTGLGATTNWNLGANWSTGVAPGAADIAVFDGTSSKVALVNANISVGGIQVDAAYGGSITQGAGRTITVGASGWTQSGSAFAGSAAAVTVNGPYSLSGGTFTSTSGILSVSGAFTVSGGTFAHNSGTLRFTGAAAAIDVPGTLTVWDLGLAQNNAVAKTLDPADVLVVAGTLTLTNGTWEGGDLHAQGPIAATSTFDGGAGTLRIDGSGDQLFTGTATVSAGELPNLVIDKPSGTLSLAGTIRVATGGWTYIGGTLDPGSSTVSFDTGSLISGSHALANVVLRGSGATTLPLAETLTVSGLLTLTNGTWDGGTLLATGDLAQASTFDGGTGTLRIGGAGAQLFTGSANSTTGQLPAVVIDKPSGTLSLAGIIRTLHDWTYLAGGLDPDSSTVVFGAALTISGSHTLAGVELRGANPKSLAIGTTLAVDGLLTLTDGTLVGGTVAAHGPIAATAAFDGGSGTLRIDGPADQLLTGTATVSAGQLPNLVIDKPSGTLSLAGTIRTLEDWTYLAGALDATGSTVSFDAGSVLAGSHTLGNVVLRGAGSVTMAAGDALTVAGLLTLTNGTWDGGTLLAAGDVTQASGFDGGTGTLRIGGSGDQLFTGTATSTNGQLPLVLIDKPAGTLSLAGTIRTLRDWTYLAGGFDPDASTLVLSGTLTLSTEGAALNRLQVRGGTSTLSGSLVLGNDLVITSGTFGLAANAVDVAGTVTVAGTLDATGADLQVAGDLLVTGTLVAGGSVITLDGGALQHLDTDGAVLGDLVIDGLVGTVIDDDVRVSGTLDLTAGTLTLGPHRLTIEHPIAGTPANLVADTTSSLTVDGTTAGIHVPASVGDLAELSIQTAETVTLDAPLNLHVSLRLDGGNLDADGHLVRIVSGATVSRTSGHVIGTLEKPVAAGGPLSVTFEIGDQSGYTPIVVLWAAVGLDGALAASTSAGDDPASLLAVGLLPAASVNRTWTLAPTGLAADPVEITATYLATDLDPLADPASLLAVVSEGGSSSLPAVVGRTATSATASVAAIPAGTLGLGMPGSNLAVTIGGGAATLVDQPYPALVTATNLGAFGGTASVTIDLDPGTTFVSATPSQGSCAPSGSSVVCALGALAAGGPATVDLVVSFGTTGAHQLVARITTAATTVDADPTNDVATLDILAALPPEPTPAGSPVATPEPSASPAPGELPNTAGGPPGLNGVVEMTLVALAGLALIALARLRPRRTRR
jgi:hypothetical protein